MNPDRLVAWGQELRAVHQRLRRALDIARESIEDGADPESLARDLQLYCVGFCVALGGHHISEDATLFPMVLADRPDLTPTVAKLVHDHSMIAHLFQGLEQAVSTAADSASLHRHLTASGPSWSRTSGSRRSSWSACSTPSMTTVLTRQRFSGRLPDRPELALG